MARELDKVLDAHEKVLWEGKPQFWPFLFGASLWTALFGIVWLIFLIPFALTLGPFIFVVPHFWIGVAMVFGPPIYRAWVYHHTYYAITSKRVILQKGIIGRDFEMIDYDQITNAEVNVGIADKVFGRDSGSILLASAGTLTYTRQGPAQRPYRLSNISSPYEVFKFFKKVSHAVKTDINYPNQKRPRHNPGYQTEYREE